MHGGDTLQTAILCTGIADIQEPLKAQTFDMPPTNITLAQAQRVQSEANQGELL